MPVVNYTLKQLSYFVAAAEQESVTKAAHALDVSQPSVSAAIAQLERAFASQLFLRHHARGLSLTASGRRFLAEARNLLAHASEVMAGPGPAGEPIRGELDIGCFLTFAPYYVPGLLRAFRARHPEIAVRLHDGDAATLQRGLGSGALDLGIVYDLALGAAFDRQVLAELPPYALLARDHPLAQAGAVSLRALAAEPFVLLDLPHSRDYFLSIFLRFGLEPDLRYRTTSFEMVRGLVANGHGVGLLNLQVPGDRSYDGKRLVCRNLRETAMPLRVVLARARRARPTRAAEAFAEVARDYFARSHAPARSRRRA